MYKILIVEDDPVIASSLARQLTRWNYEATYVQEFDHVMQEFEKAQPDLVLMDITMPNMDGLEALKAIRSKDDKANVVMCSAMGQEAMVVEAVQAGIKDFIVKPFKEDRLMKAVNTILGNG